MNIFLLSLLDKSIGGAMVRLSLLPVQFPILSPKHQQILVGLTEKVLNTYIAFFQSVGVIPSGFEYAKKTIVKKFNSSDFINENLNCIEKKLINLIKTPIITSVIPVNVRLNRSGFLLWYTGVGILEGTDQSSEFFLHEFSISTMAIRYSSGSLHYLDKLLQDDNISESVSPRKLAAKSGKNYNQFQKDCRNHFGDTFHQFHNKMKMLDVVTDVLFTNFSLKEIAYRNHFFNYNSMYILFRKKYKFPIDSIPRLLTEI
jgi:AraC-like DNA-binding protein